MIQRVAVGLVLSLAVVCQLGCNDRATPGELGQRPDEPGLMYSECESPDDCETLLYCIHPPNESGFCSERCSPIDDPEGCEPPPGGSANRFCAEIGQPSANLCALDCAGGKTCPGGMLCQRVETNAGERSICF